MGLLTPCFVPRGGFLYTKIVPGGGFLLPSSRVPWEMVLDEIDTGIKLMLKLTFNSSTLIKVSNWDLKRALDQIK